VNVLQLIVIRILLQRNQVVPSVASGEQEQTRKCSVPYGRYGSKYSSDSINNPYGAGSPYSNDPIYVVPSR